MVSISSTSQRLVRTSSGASASAARAPQSVSAQTSASPTQGAACEAVDAFQGAPRAARKTIDPAELAAALEANKPGLIDTFATIVRARISGHFWISLVFKPIIWMMPTFIASSVNDKLLPALQPMMCKHAAKWSEARAQGSEASLSDYMMKNQDTLSCEIMDALGEIARTARHTTLRDQFAKPAVRKTIDADFRASIPELAAMIEQHGKDAFPSCA